MGNALYYGDNLGYLQEMDRESVDLIYLDPPFNSNADYNLLFRSQGNAVEAQTTAFKDTWTWLESADAAFADVMASGSAVIPVLSAFRSSLGTSNLMAYLTMMAVRLIEMHRILKGDGALYLHCDPTASHYLKVILDATFGAENFRSEIVWRRSGSHNSTTRQFGPIHDCLLFYAKSGSHRLRPVYTPHTKSYIDGEFRYDDERGRYRLNEIMGPGRRTGDSGQSWNGYDPSRGSRHWAIPESLKRLLKDSGVGMSMHQQLDALLDLGEIYMSRNGRPKYKQRPTAGVPLQDIWAYQPGTEGCLWDTDRAIDRDVKWLDNEAEKVGYPTQKPIGLLERIIRSSADVGGIVLDPFCGCGTTIEAAERTARAWIGIDITHHAIDVVEGRLNKRHPTTKYEVRGRPEDLESALRLAGKYPYEYQWWANWKLGVQRYRERKKGPDKGIDGIIHFYNVPHGAGQVIISVKAGENLKPDMVDGLAGTMKREGAQLGVFVCAGTPSERSKIWERAAAQGHVQIGAKRYPAVQIITAEDLVKGRSPLLPRVVEDEVFRQSLRPARPVRGKEPSPQLSLTLPITGRQKSDTVEDHLPGKFLADLADLSAAG